MKAVSYIHNNQRVHRDLRASNVFLGGSGVVKIADLGGAIRPPERPYWLAPECITKEAIGPEVDVWALGILALQMAGNLEPYKDETITKVSNSSYHVIQPSSRKKRSFFLDEG